MEPQPSTSAAAAAVAVASTSGSPPAPLQQRQTEEQLAVYLEASVNQLLQSWGATWRVKLQRYPVADAPAPVSNANEAVAPASESNSNAGDAPAPEPNANATPSSSGASADSGDVSKVKVEEDTSFCEEVPLAPSGSIALRGASKLMEYSNSESDSSSDEDIKVFAASRVAPSTKQRPVAKVVAKNGAASRTRPATQRRGGLRTAIKLEDDSDSTTGNGSCSEDDDNLKDVRVPSAGPLAKEKRAASKKKTRKGVSDRKSSFPCAVCKKTYSSKSNLNAHMNKHTGERRYKCQKCGRSFWCQSTYLYHKKKRDQRNGVCPREIGKHDGSWRPKGSWTCEICGKKMKHPKSYLDHMRMHRGEKTYKCEECGKAFVTNSKLSLHSRIHTGVWKFTCVFCGKGFHQQPNYWTHLRVHTEEKPYFCVVDGCGASFGLLATLKKHRRMLHLKKY